MKSLKDENMNSAEGSASWALDSDRNITFNLSLKNGTYEHLSEKEQFEVASFLRLKGLRSPHTLRLYSRQLEKFLWWMGYKQQTQIDEWMLMDYQQALLNPSEAMKAAPVPFTPCPTATADQYFQVIRSFCSHLHEKQILRYNPAKQVPSLDIRNAEALRERKHFTKTQWQQILDTLISLPEQTPGQRNRKVRLKFCILFQHAMALRVHEMANHQHAHIVQSDSVWQLRIVGKGRRARVLTLNEDALEILMNYRLYWGLPALPQGEPLPLLPSIKPVSIKTRGPHTGTHINSKAVSCGNWQQMFAQFIRADVMDSISEVAEQKEAAYKAHWSHLSPHSLRHTRITQLANEGKDLLWLQRFAGHENVNTTAHYYHG